MKYKYLIMEKIKKNIFGIVGLLVGILSVCGSVFYVLGNKCPQCESCSSDLISYVSLDDEEEKTEEVDVKMIKCDIKGAVKKPGVYELKEGMTISDGIEAAGGITSSGTTNNINLSKKLSDEMVVYVFTKNELKSSSSTNSVVCEVPKCECETVAINNNTIDASNNSNTTTSSTSSANDGLISINSNSIEELTQLEGIGEARAQAIIDYRKEHGDFKTIEDIQNVSGIGEKAFEKIKNRIKV